MQNYADFFDFFCRGGLSEACAEVMAERERTHLKVNSGGIGGAGEDSGVGPSGGAEEGGESQRGFALQK